MRDYQAKQAIEKKAEWGNGVWQAEPDVASWTDEGTGLPVEVKRHELSGTLSVAVGVEPGHPAAGKDIAEVPVLAPQARPTTERRDGKWWFVHHFDQPGDGHPGLQRNIERYRNMHDAQALALSVAHAIHRFAGQVPRTGAAAVNLAGLERPENITTEVPAMIRHKEDALGVGDPQLRRAGGDSISGPYGQPAPPSNEPAAVAAAADKAGTTPKAAADASATAAAAAATDAATPDDDTSPDSSSSKRSKKKS